MPSMPAPPNSLEMSPESTAITVSLPTRESPSLQRCRSTRSAKRYRPSQPETFSWRPFFEVMPSEMVSAMSVTSALPVRTMAENRACADPSATLPMPPKTSARSGLDVCAIAFSAILSAMGRLLSGCCHRYYSGFRKSLPAFSPPAKIYFSPYLQAQTLIRDNLSRKIRDKGVVRGGVDTKEKI